MEEEKGKRSKEEREGEDDQGGDLGLSRGKKRETL